MVVHDNALLVMRRNKFGSEYYTLVGGGVEPGENLESALYREVSEETGIEITDPQLVFIEEAGKPYGTQFIYLCRYVGGDVALSPESDEARINELGQNTYHPQWLPVTELQSTVFLSADLKQRLIRCLESGQWPSPAERFGAAGVATGTP